MEQTIDDKDSQLERQQAAAHTLQAELAAAQAALASKAGELVGAGAELEAARGKLADATAAMQDAHEQLSELQVRRRCWPGGWETAQCCRKADAFCRARCRLPVPRRSGWRWWRRRRLSLNMN